MMSDKKKWIILFLGIRFMPFRSTDVLDDDVHDDDDVLSFLVFFSDQNTVSMTMIIVQLWFLSLSHAQYTQVLKRDYDGRFEEPEIESGKN